MFGRFYGLETAFLRKPVVGMVQSCPYLIIGRPAFRVPAKAERKGRASVRRS